MDDERDEHPGRHGLPAGENQNHEEEQPVEPTKRRPGDAEGGDPDAGGESGEGTQSTGNPHGAG